MKLFSQKSGALLIAASLAFSACFGLVGCGGTQPEQTQATQQTQAKDTLEATELNIQAAASLKYSMDELIADWNKEHSSVTIKANYDASGTLAEQIKQGAPADLFISANQSKMDDVDKAGMVKENTRKDFLENELVLIVPADSKLSISKLDDLTSDNVKKIAVGEPNAVPAGKYAQESFESAKISDKVAAKLVQGKDVTQVLTYVASGDVDAGLVYKTDALTQPDKVKIVSVVEGHKKVIYPAALLKDSKSPTQAEAFFKFISSDKAQAVFEKYGFKLVK